MAKILPFKGILYDKDRVKDLEAVVAPPYDVISRQMQDELYKSHVNNIVRIILGRELKKDNRKNNKYTRAAKLFSNWLKSGILKQDRRPSVYIYEQRYLHKGRLKKRIGFISLMKIEDPASSLVLPHEYTFSKPKEDRLNLISTTNANTSPIFCLFKDSGNDVTRSLRRYAVCKKADIDIHYEGVTHKLWRCPDSVLIDRLEKGLLDKQVFIADGHHRYEVALGFRDLMIKKLGRRQAGKFGYLMVYLSNLTDGGLTVLSTYRVIRDIGNINWGRIAKEMSRYFIIKDVKNKKDMLKMIERAKKGCKFGVYFKNRRFYLLTLKDGSALDDIIKVDKSHAWKRLNVTILHFLVFDHILHIDRHSSNDKNIIYTRDEDYAISLVDNGECEIAFFQPPAKVLQVQDIARDGERMPHKSTYFYPKLLTGLVINKF